MNLSNRPLGRGICGPLGRCLWLLCLIGLPLAALAQPSQVLTGPAPAWVEALAPGTGGRAAADQVSQGQHYLLSDTQVRVDAQGRTSFHHVALQALNERGVEQAANIDIRFDPAYQALTLHSLNVRRGDTVIAKLRQAKVRVLQRETELDSLIFDGSRTAHVFLDDVRVGDVVEYSYSLRGQNPVFRGRLFGFHDLQWRVPVARVLVRLVWPQGRPLHLRRLQGAPAPVVREQAGFIEHRWERLDVPALQVEGDAPAWYDPYPAVHWSEFEDWAAVAQWAVPLYRVPATPTPRLRAEVARLAALHGDAESRLLGALRFVQREIRYLGIETGASSHAPSSPEVVLQRRFGDCKDKTLLLLAVLQGLGIDAQAVLVNTRVRSAIQGWQPSPGAFNHVLVRANVGERWVWLDPTRAPQMGGLQQLVQADYGPALVVAATTSGLQAMAGEAALLRKREVRAMLDLRGGFDKPAAYTVTTHVVGASADALRATLANTSREALQKDFVNFYASHFGKVEMAAPLEVADEPAGNRLTTVERYTLLEFWQRADKRKRLEGTIEVPELLEQLRLPKTPVRNSPLALNHPLDLQHVTRVQLPQAWQLSLESQRVQDPAFDYSREARLIDPLTLELTDHYKSMSDHVPAADIGRYTASLEKVRAQVAYVLYRGDPVAGDGPHWLVAVVGLITVLALGLGLRRLYRWDPLPRPAAAGAPRGLAGWLLLLAVVLVVGPYRAAAVLVEAWPAYQAAGWLSLTTVGEPGYHPLWSAVMLFGLVGNLSVMAAAALLAVLFLRRRSSFPPLMLGFLLGSQALALVDAMLVTVIPAAQQQSGGSATPELFRGLLSMALWVAYLLRSQRVRATFVERWGKPVEVGVGVAAAPEAPVA